MAGILYIVATPIGNLEDITARAARLLGQVDLIACEDTRQTRKLLQHLGISRRLVSYHEHNEAQRAPWLLQKLVAGASVALVCDAGTPLVSDPGLILVRRATEQAIPVVPVPGPSALLAALSASGLAADRFYFGGFLPPKRAQRRQTLEQLQALDCTLVFYEAPHRILETLSDIADLFGDRSVAVARELTKIHEEFLRGTAASVRAELAVRPSVKGEFTVLVGAGIRRQAPAPDPSAIRAAFEEFERRGMSRMEAVKAAARACGVSKREAYRLIAGR
jgi:16S rRNA (cytidine1402-2'-O)-methyltransferase